MTRAKELLDAATPLPWTVKRNDVWKTADVIASDGDEATGNEYDAGRAHANAALIVYAVNRLPDYEAALEALAAIIDSYDAGTLMNPHMNDARAALARLRDEVTA